MQETILALSAIPRFAVGMRFRFDAVRDAWVVLGPERAFVPDTHAVEVLQLVDGARSIEAIVDDLAARFDAPKDLIAEDVLAMLRDLAAKGAIRL
jgi:pyrroloquinoline quinone biosynthesis protein D